MSDAVVSPCYTSVLVAAGVSVKRLAKHWRIANVLLGALRAISRRHPDLARRGAISFTVRSIYLNFGYFTIIRFSDILQISQ
ncbi:hypothetical protein IHE33_00185 [Mycetohabitans endofungorum]|uniref:hypothetical protein n=1 Tax=Mycetohabitans endofungorum TaxID=417203 RepID=UPI0030CCCC1B